MKTAYDINAAIYLRVPNPETADAYGNWRALDFKQSIELVKMPGFLMGFYFPGDCLLEAKNRGGKMTREEWHKLTRGLRSYYYRLSQRGEPDYCLMCGANTPGGDGDYCRECQCQI